MKQPVHKGPISAPQAQVCLRTVQRNLLALRRRMHPAVRIVAVVKADAYGHGAVAVARALRQVGVEHWAVASVQEAVKLREAGIEGAILVLGVPLYAELPLYERYGLELAVTSPEVAEWVLQGAYRLTVHVEVDTGMARLGLSPECVPSYWERLKAHPSVRLAGLYTHFASADEPENRQTREQIRRFRALLSRLSPDGVMVHAANSAAIVHYPEAHFDAVRPGLALYGYAPNPLLQASSGLEPALRFVGRVVALRRLARGASVGYGATWRAPRPTVIATVNAGYADGIDRRLSNRGFVEIHGRRYPIVGRVNMDFVMVEVGPQSPVRFGDPVVLFGSPNWHAWHWAEVLDTTPYEVLTRLGARVERVYEGDGE
ncbi:MAG: alanine racemase [Bacteroidetes bacterium]|nr:alanine racemase [Rhodothermia bacterium]MCS7155642.1 alanine racemase [Bacteroidota bacterium]MCX7906501.1 alanine racemase [Bacteroidota bacterium]MDW8137218.1 alanine racemase [Bacteroidota bacterium]MDW8284912.1 alanine racemase [Bacteroidota bacterium]